MKRRMLIRVAHVLVLLALPALPVWSDSYTQCFRVCINEMYPDTCGGVPPEAEQACGTYLIEACRCQCYPPEYCP